MISCIRSYKKTESNLYKQIDQLEKDKIMKDKDIEELKEEIKKMEEKFEEDKKSLELTFAKERSQLEIDLGNVKAEHAKLERFKKDEADLKNTLQDQKEKILQMERDNA